MAGRWWHPASRDFLIQGCQAGAFSQSLLGGGLAWAASAIPTLLLYDSAVRASGTAHPASQIPLDGEGWRAGTSQSWFDLLPGPAGMGTSAMYGAHGYWVPRPLQFEYALLHLRQVSSAPHFLIWPFFQHHLIVKQTSSACLFSRKEEVLLASPGEPYSKPS